MMQSFLGPTVFSIRRDVTTSSEIFVRLHHELGIEASDLVVPRWKKVADRLTELYQLLSGMPSNECKFMDNGWMNDFFGFKVYKTRRDLTRSGRRLLGKEP